MASTGDSSVLEGLTVLHLGVRGAILGLVHIGDLDGGLCGKTVRIDKEQSWRAGGGTRRAEAGGLRRETVDLPTTGASWISAMMKSS